MPSTNIRDAFIYTMTLDLDEEDTHIMNGLEGYLAWNMHVRIKGGMVFEYPQGDPPLVSLEACSN